MTKTVRCAFGVVLIAAGLFAIPVPVIPGTPLIAAGMALLDTDRPLFQAWRAWFTAIANEKEK